MAVDWSTLDSGTPRSEDGRTYPRHLHVYEKFDAEILPRAAALPKFTFDDLALKLEDPKARHALGSWLTSARWRGLVERVPPDPRRAWTYGVTPRGRDAVKLPA